MNPTPVSMHVSVHTRLGVCDVYTAQPAATGRLRAELTHLGTCHTPGHLSAELTHLSLCSPGNGRACLCLSMNAKGCDLCTLVHSVGGPVSLCLCIGKHEHVPVFPCDSMYMFLHPHNNPPLFFIVVKYTGKNMYYFNHL